MTFLHAREHLSDGDIVVVQSDTQCNVMVMDDTNFRAYRSGGQFTYFGGFYTHFPARIAVPTADNWNTVLSLPPGRQANIRHSISYIR